MKKVVFALLLLPALIQAQSEVGINTNHPVFDLDIHGVYNDTLVQAASVLQLTDTSQLNFLRLYSGRGNDPKPFIAFSNSDTFSLVSTSPDWMQFERVMSIVPNGNMGIRTVFPEFDIDVRGMDNDWDGGELQLATPDETNFLRFFGGRQGDKNPFIAFHDTDTFHLVTTSKDWTTFQRRMSIYPNGYVGIGTDTPLAKLDIVAPGDSSNLLRFGTDRPWVFRQYNSGVITKLALQSEINDKAFEVMTPNGNRVARFMASDVFSKVSLVPESGEVGIGIEEPTAKLEIAGNSNLGYAQLKLSEDGDDYARMKFTNSSHPASFWDLAAQTDTLQTGARVNFFYSGPEGSGDRLTIRGDGNVGIGTTVPEAQLDVKGGDWNLDAGNPGDLRIGNPTHNFRLGIATGGGGAGLTRMYSSNALFLGTAGETRMAINSVGNIGIGTTNPNNKVRIVGNTSSNGHVLSVTTAYSGLSNVRAIEGFAYPANGYGVGARLEGGYRGVRAYAYGNSSTGHSIAVEASAFGTTGTRTGLFGRASGGTTNWAGYFAEGNVYVTNELRIGSGASGGVAGYKLVLDGKMMAEEVRVQLSSAWPDYVFEKNYDLPDISEIASFIDTHKHLPGIPSAKEVDEAGLELGEMQRLLLEKIEELTLYTIEQEKRIKALEQQITNNK